MGHVLRILSGWTNVVGDRQSPLLNCRCLFCKQVVLLSHAMIETLREVAVEHVDDLVVAVTDHAQLHLVSWVLGVALAAHHRLLPVSRLLGLV